MVMMRKIKVEMMSKLKTSRMMMMKMKMKMVMMRKMKTSRMTELVCWQRRLLLAPWHEP